MQQPRPTDNVSVRWKQHAAIVIVTIATVVGVSATLAHAAGAPIRSDQPGFATGDELTVVDPWCPAQISSDRGLSWRPAPATSCIDEATPNREAYDARTGSVIAYTRSHALIFDRSGQSTTLSPPASALTASTTTFEAIASDEAHLYALLGAWNDGEPTAIDASYPNGRGYMRRLEPDGTWTSCGPTPPDPSGSSGRRIVDGARTPPSVWVSPDGAVNWISGTGVIRSTDKCASWTRAEQPLCTAMGAVGPYHVAYLCEDPDHYQVADVRNPGLGLRPAPLGAGALVDRAAIQPDGLARVIDGAAFPEYPATWPARRSWVGVAPAGTQQLDAIERLNARYRRPLGMTDAASYAALELAAHWHSDYVHANGWAPDAGPIPGAHYELRTLPGFTAPFPPGRCLKAGASVFRPTACGEGATLVGDVIDSNLRVPGHALNLIGSELVGAYNDVVNMTSFSGTDLPTGTTIDPTKPVNTPDSAVRLWPAEGMASSDPWVGNEIPNPMASYSGKLEPAAGPLYVHLLEPGTVTLDGPAGAVALFVPDVGGTESTRPALPGTGFVPVIPMGRALPLGSYKLTVATATGRTYAVVFQRTEAARVSTTAPPRLGKLKLGTAWRVATLARGKALQARLEGADKKLTVRATLTISAVVARRYRIAPGARKPVVIAAGSAFTMGSITGVTPLQIRSGKPMQRLLARVGRARLPATLTLTARATAGTATIRRSVRL